MSFRVEIEKPPPERKIIAFRKTWSIDTQSFMNDIRVWVSKLGSCYNIGDRVDQYNTILSQFIDEYAPEKQHTVTIRHQTPWFSKELHEEKIIRRKLEGKWRSTKSEEDREIFKRQRQKVQNMNSTLKKEFYTSTVKQQNDPKGLFKLINTLLHKRKDLPLPCLPPHESASELAEEFSDHFAGKIEKIRGDLIQLQGNITDSDDEGKMYITEMLFLTPATEEEIKSILLKSPTMACELDPIPTWLLKVCIDEVLPLITEIINLSLSTAIMPKSQKTAIIKPYLKKIILELIIKIYRPVSNLSFLSKTVERVVVKRLIQHQNENNLQEQLQSAYQQFHSTETALIKVTNDILMAIDQQKLVLLVLLDLSAAFDTIDDTILLKRLSNRIGIKGNALKWFQSYLSDRYQYVKVEGQSSRSVPLNHSVPQGSSLGPYLINIYMTPLADILKELGIEFHVYADDHQLYLAFRLIDQDSADVAVNKIQRCMVEVKLDGKEYVEIE